VSPDTTRACVVDLDGVVWLTGKPLPNAREGIEALRGKGVPVLFATNNAAPTVGELLERLAAIGIEASANELATSSQAAASLLDPGSTAYVVGEAGLREALASADVHEDSDGPDAVVVGLTRSFDYETCAIASSFIRNGATYIATNNDATLPGSHGLLPGAGSIVAAISTASGTQPIIAGKPFEPMARLVTSRCPVGAVIGDRPSTDGAFAARLGVPFALVASDVDEGNDEVALRAVDLLGAVRLLYR
jgi:HAD superfamily hydrolase (TIGR01450 family)